MPQIIYMKIKLVNVNKTLNSTQHMVSARVALIFFIILPHYMKSIIIIHSG